MWYKYIISQEGMTLAIKIDVMKNQVVLGGWSRFHEQIQIIKADYFRARGRGPIFPMHNKIKYIFNMDLKTFKKVLRKLEQDQFIIQKVESHGRLIR